MHKPIQSCRDFPSTLVASGLGSYNGHASEGAIFIAVPFLSSHG